MLKVGLTGNIGSGKSTVSEVFKILGIPVYDADTEAKKILDKKETINKITSFFGTEILNSKDIIDRKKLAAIVFANNDKLTTLNNIIHPALRIDFEEWMNKLTQHYCIMESAILFETDYYKMFDKIICVSSPQDMAISRVMKRENAERADILKRLNNQISEKEKTDRADFIIINDEKSLIIPQVLKMHYDLSLIK